ncbi:ATP-binding protein [Azovibrio restrictus]|uniref:ATP-binding protein n=1 Tax=Azovibrio restrictus TaxID=146938 RepID=UPI0026EA6662|nr:ATP-binding protein [Azovibrio restrictus]
MTGTEPRDAAGNGTERPRRRLLWRGRRYSLSRIFFNFYLLAMSTFVAIAFFADALISTALKGITDDYARRFMRGTILMIEEELFRYPKSSWEKRIRILDEKFAYRLAIMERDQLDLPEPLLAQVDAGHIAIHREGEIMYYALRQTGQVLVLGPLSPRHNPELQPPGLPLEMQVRLLTWTVIGLLFAIALWFWVRPIWRDLEALRQTARALGEGDLGARSPGAQSKLFAPLADTLDGMAEQIQRLIATQKELSSAISHELRTPIARLRFASEMMGEADSPAERQRLSTMMENDLEELDNLIDSSLTYARFERETPLLNLSPVDFAEWLEDQVDNMRILGRDLELQLELGALPPDLRVELDRKVMPHAISNLLRNAIKYATQRIRVSSQLDNGHIQVHVDDDGIGIPPEERERVFSAFTRLDRSRDRSTGGYGLGLAITRRVMELHGGTACVSDSPLGGARFTLSWPCPPRT